MEFRAKKNHRSNPYSYTYRNPKNPATLTEALVTLILLLIVTLPSTLHSPYSNLIVTLRVIRTLTATRRSQ